MSLQLSVKKNSRKKVLYRYSSTYYRRVKIETHKLENDYNMRTSYDAQHEKFDEIIEDDQIIETSGENTNSIDNLESNQIFSGITDDSDNENISESFSEDYIKNSSNKVIDLSLKLQKWALDKKIPHDHLNALLSILNNFIGDDYGLHLPKDGRTLLSTPRSVDIVPMGNGEFWYYGIEKNLKTVFAEKSPPDVLNLIFNMDGLPPFNSSNIEMWPILFSVDGIKAINPMVAAIYCGYGKPPLECYLSSLVDELKRLMDEGFLWNSKKIEVRLKCIVCDSPARSFIKGNYVFCKICNDPVCIRHTVVATKMQQK